MDGAVIVAVEILSSIATLAIIALGLAIVFGMMRVINIAHGEFIMLGGYIGVIATTSWGINFWISILVIAPLVVGLFGVVVERLVIRRLYGRMVDTLLATWGLSLFLIGGVTMIFGNSVEGVSAPFGGVPIGDYTISGYRLFLIVMAVALLASVYATLRYTKLGLIARGAMQNPQMAATLGIDPNRVYMVTFGVGAALSGLAGGLLAPLTGVIPTMGASFIAQAFITVIGGGAAIVTGTALASTLFGSISKLVEFATTPVIGDAALLFVALFVLRMLPQGITGRFFRRAS
jgi:branched-subunit amino acid ABC-type transport system permease component